MQKGFPMPWLDEYTRAMAAAEATGMREAVRSAAWAHATSLQRDAPAVLCAASRALWTCASRAQQLAALALCAASATLAGDACTMYTGAGHVTLSGREALDEIRACVCAAHAEDRGAFVTADGAAALVLVGMHDAALSVLAGPVVGDGGVRSVLSDEDCRALFVLACVARGDAGSMRAVLDRRTLGGFVLQGDLRVRRLLEVSLLSRNAAFVRVVVDECLLRPLVPRALRATLLSSVL